MYELLGVSLPFEEFDYLICQQNAGKELKVIDGKVVAVERVATEEEKIQIQIEELKALLEATDYQAIKFAEGILTAEEYAPIKAQRQAWRDEINMLEND